MHLLQFYTKLKNGQRRIAGFVGCDIHKKNFKVTNPFLLATFINAIIYYFVNAYSMVKFSDEMVPFVFCIVTYGIGIQGGDKLRAYVFHRDSLKKLDKCLVNFYTENDKLPLYLQKEVEEHLKICELVVRLVNIIYFLCGPLLISFPFILMKITHEEKLLIFGFVFPGIDYKSSPGYEINFVFQLIQVYCICIGVNCSDAYNTLLLLNARIQLHVIIGKLKILDKFIAEGGSAKEQNRMLNEIIENHVTLTWYMRNFENNFSSHYLLFLMTASLQVTLTIFVLLTTTWYIGIILLIHGEFQLLMVCLLGSIYASKCDELEREIYNIEWYSMELSQQKKIIFFLKMAQRPIKPSFGGVGFLSLHTFLEVNKNVYSCLMVFLNFV